MLVSCSVDDSYLERGVKTCAGDDGQRILSSDETRGIVLSVFFFFFFCVLWILDQ